VVTSNTVLADLAHKVGGEKVDVRALAPRGADPHTFQPTPDTMRQLGQAKVVFFNGAGLEEWWAKAVKAIPSKGTPVIELSRGLATLKQPAGSHPGHGHGDGADPHVWLDPLLTRQYVERIRDGLARVDPANGPHYAERTRAYQQELDALDAWIRAEVEKVPPARRKLVTFHNAFQYFAARYGFAVKGYIVASPGKDPSAKRMAELVKRIKQEGIPAVFAEADFNPKLLETLAREAGVKVVTNLYDGSLSDGPPADSYVNMMRHNVTMITNALK
jgi:ABC-type Zn uptake system ZnuABC Zn-binding protein ZnuA